MKQDWTNKYIGIPFQDKGRDTTGIDCYGLARLIYKQELGIDLPSFTAEYEEDDTARMQELISQYKEGWEEVQEPEPGSIAVFKILGFDSHIGIAVNKEQFLHAREGQDSAIESFSNIKWKNRLVGHYKYKEKTGALLNAVPHPLRTQRFTTAVPAGTSVEKLSEWIVKEYGIEPELKSKVTILLNTRVIPLEQWSNTFIQDGDVIDYRAVPGKSNTLRLIFTLAVAVYAGGVAAGMVASGSSAFAAGITAAAINVGGALLLNAIAPITAPKQHDPGTSEQMYMVTGGANNAQPYEAIPFILGKVRHTPPLGSQNVISYGSELNSSTSYYNMLLCWGYGPLEIYEDTIKLGEVAIANYQIPAIQHIEGKSTETQGDRDKLDAIYGSDFNQVYSGLELVCDGGPTDIAASYSGSATYTVETNTSAMQVIFNTTPSAGQNVTATFTSTSGMVNWTLATTKLSNVVTTSPDANTRVVTGTTTATNATITYSRVGNFAGSYTAEQLQYDGPWTTITTTDDVEALEIAIHFPQGLRRIKSKGDDAGKSFNAPTSFRAEYQLEGSGTWVLLSSFTVGSNAFYKDGFTHTKSFSISENNLPANTGLSVRIRRETGDLVEVGSYQYSHTAILNTVTFRRNTKPVVEPLNTKLAMTALRIQATDQLTNRIEGINAIVQTRCLDWNGTNWVEAATSNPASLFRYVLESPANPRRITDAASKIDLAKLQYWHTYCVGKGFTYNSIIASPRSVLDILREICAAGRASPALKDGKWTVNIDEPQAVVVQHFSPHNSWGFEATKSLAKIPDGLKIQFYDEDQNYQQVETTVWNIGKDADNAVLFESIDLPGVTKASLAKDHGKWHLAQMKLRPEVYTLNSDFEYLVCNRGDRVKVSHDVPMWGLGSGRIKNRISSTVFQLDEYLTFVAGTQYTIRVRSKTGVSTTRTVAAVGTSGSYNQVTLTTSATASEIDAGDLFLFGELNNESQDLVVLSIEPTSNKTARLTLVDYGVTQDYNIFTDYLTLSESVVFETQISLPPVISQDAFGSLKPLITEVYSAKEGAERLSPGTWQYNIKVSYVNNGDLPVSTQYVELQYDLSASTDESSTKIMQVPYQTGSFTISDILEGSEYKVRLRYVSANGIAGQWTNWTTHVAAGFVQADVHTLTIDVDRVTRYLNVTPFVSEAYLPEEFKTYEIRVFKDAGTGDFWDTVNADIKVIYTTGTANFNLRDFPTPRLSQSGIKYRIACRMLDTSNTYVSTSALSEVVLTNLV